MSRHLECAYHVIHLLMNSTCDANSAQSMANELLHIFAFASGRANFSFRESACHDRVRHFWRPSGCSDRLGLKRWRVQRSTSYRSTCNSSVKCSFLPQKSEEFVQNSKMHLLISISGNVSFFQLSHGLVSGTRRKAARSEWKWPRSITRVD